MLKIDEIPKPADSDAHSVETFVKTSIPYLEALKASISNFDPYLKNIPHSQIHKDFETLKQASEKLFNLSIPLNSPSIERGKTEEEYRIIRHDLRAYISTIKGYGELITEELSADEDQQAFEKIKVIIQHAENILPLITSIGGHQNASSSAQVNKTLPFCPVKMSYKGRILIVDDSPEKRDTLRRRLVQEDHTVLQATDGISALQLLEKNSVDLILLDMIMPHMTGDEVLYRLKSSARTQHIPVLIISSLDEINKVAECIEAGAEDYLSLPLNPILLRARVNACLDKTILRKREQKAIKDVHQERQRLIAAIESMEDGFAIFDKDDKLVASNQIFQDFFPTVRPLGGKGFTYSEFLQKNFSEKLYTEERRSYPSNGSQPILTLEIMLQHHENPTIPYEIRLAEGRWIEIKENQIPGGGIVSIYKEITERKTREEKVRYQALHDPLTAAYNRIGFTIEAERLLESAHHQKTGCALFYMDLDGFKGINDTFGHAAGDEVLIDFAKFLSHITRENDLLMRHGGDEFCMLLSNISTPPSAINIANRILKEMPSSYTLNQQTLAIGASIGIALYPFHGVTLTGLMAAADKAMYTAKKNGKGAFHMAPTIA